ncbi:MAG TPA: 1-acyl-sn-glycerol-3-phosphate acyltransferase [Nocardioides sp.]|uniref:1-acyl-sn-glycerol-3-phosphate acyltransferase n=1 Tax=Nocardioides sp. TaxID=35761 RepID=UPI002F3E910A
MTRAVLWVLRRAVIAPAMILLAVGLWVLLPLWLIVTAALVPVLPGRWRLLRILWLTVVWVTAESLLLVILLGWWLASGFGRRIRTAYWQGVHYDLVQGLMYVVFREARRVLALRVETAGPDPDAYPGKPLIVASRHAGPGDSFTLIHALMHWYGREPRVVLKDTLAWDPAVDVVMNRIPARFVSAGKGTQDFEAQIADLARDLDGNDAFVIFPEGGNFTPARRQRGIDRLRRLGLERMARRAERMTHVLAPRPGGLLAALDAAPEADVVLVAHTGLDHVLTVGDVWRELPMDKVIVMQWWQVPRAEIPAGREARIEWLFAWWERIDGWIAEHRPQELSRGRSRRTAKVG